MRSIPGRAQPLMTTTDTTGRALLLIAIVAAATFEALALLLRPLVAHGVALLLTLAGWRPSPARPAQAPLQQAPAPPAAQAIPPAPIAATAAPRPQLERLPVRELRLLARAAGHRALARSGRRTELLAALAGS
jgi:hypothetical protein